MRSILTCVVLLLGLGAVSAPGIVEADEPSVPAAARDFAQRLQKTLDAGDKGPGLTPLVDIPALAKRVSVIAVWSDVSDLMRRALHGAILKEMGSLMGTLESVPPAKTVHLVGYQPQEAGRARLTTRLVDTEGTSYFVVWRLVDRDGTWMAEDWERLDQYASVAAFMALGMLPEVPQVPAAKRKAARALMEASDHFDEGENAQAWSRLLDVPKGLLPTHLDGLRSVFRAALGPLVAGAEEALADVARARILVADSPALNWLAAQIHAEMGSWEPALKAAIQHRTQVAPWAAGWELEGRAQRALDRPVHALEAFTKALAEEPTWILTVGDWVSVLPAERFGEMAARLKRVPNLPLVFWEAAQIVEDTERPDALQALVRAFETLHPEHSDGPFYRGVALRMEGKTAEALTAFTLALARQTEADEVDFYQEPCLDLWAALGKWGEGLTASKDKPSAWRYLSRQVQDAGSVKGIDAVVAWARAHLDPAPDTLALVQAEGAWLRKDHAAVVRLLEGWLTAARVRVDEDQDEDATEALWDAEDRIVRSLIRLQQFDRALEEGQFIHRRDEDPTYEALVRAHLGEHAQAADLIRKTIDQEWKSAEDFRADDDLRPFLDRKEYAFLK